LTLAERVRSMFDPAVTVKSFINDFVAYVALAVWCGPMQLLTRASALPVAHASSLHDTRRTLLASCY
jgi:hypothetical protein